MIDEKPRPSSVPHPTSAPPTLEARKSVWHWRTLAPVRDADALLASPKHSERARRRKRLFLTWEYPLIVDHHGNQNSSVEEQAAVEQLVERLLKPSGVWINKKGEAEALAPKHILVVAPYNAQVGLSERLAPRGIQVGTVDKFQGLEAPIVIYS